MLSHNRRHSETGSAKLCFAPSVAQRRASCYGAGEVIGINSVPGLSDQLVAVSSDRTLPNPITDGPDKLEEVLAGRADGA